MRLIDADALWNALQNEINKASPPYNDTVGAIRCGVRLARNILEDTPTIDAVPVVRCCDCVHFEYFENQFVQMTRCDVHDRCPDYTDYCSWAERRRENECK